MPNILPISGVITNPPDKTSSFRYGSVFGLHVAIPHCAATHPLLACGLRFQSPHRTNALPFRSHRASGRSGSGTEPAIFPILTKHVLFVLKGNVTGKEYRSVTAYVFEAQPVSAYLPVAYKSLTFVQHLLYLVA